MLFLWMSKNHQYRTETPVQVEVVSRLGIPFLYRSNHSLITERNEGGRARRLLSSCVSHRMSIPNQSASYDSPDFFHLCFMFFPTILASFIPSPLTFLSTLMCFHGSPRIVHLGFPPDSPGPRPTTWHTYIFARTFHSSLCSHKFPSAKPLMHA